VGKLQGEDRLYGLYDPVEGGFFRYALLRNWSMPHFEKMLRENAEIIGAYIKAYELNRRSGYRNLAEGALKYVMNRLYDDKRGYFYGSQVADEVYYHLNGEERARVKAPLFDRTGYTSPNSRMVVTLLEAWRVFGVERYKTIASQALDFYIVKMIGRRGVLSYFNHQKEKGELDGRLEDNTWMAIALLEGFRTLKQDGLLERAENVLDFMLSELYDSSAGGFFERSSSAKKFYRAGELVSRKKPYVSNGVAAYALVRAYEITGKDKYLQKARQTVGAFVDEYPDASQPYFQRAALRLRKIESTKRMVNHDGGKKERGR